MGALSSRHGSPPPATLAIAVGVTAALVGCAEEKTAPLVVISSASITDITDNTATGDYTVDAATLTTTGFGTELELAFTILNSNGIKFNPVSAITFSDGSVVTCEAGDLRHIPSLVESTDSWDFACDGSVPEDSDGARLVIVDIYNTYRLPLARSDLLWIPSWDATYPEGRWP